MKKKLLLLLLCFFALFGVTGCDSANESSNDNFEEKDNYIEQEVSVIEANGFTLEYGTYKDSGGYITITLYSDGTCKYVGVDPNTAMGNYDLSGKCYVVQVTNDHENITADVLEVSLDNGIESQFYVKENNVLSNQWISLKYIDD